MSKSTKLIIALMMASTVITSCGRKGALKPPPDARPIPQTISQEDESNSSSQPAQTVPVTTQ